MIRRWVTVAAVVCASAVPIHSGAAPAPTSPTQIAVAYNERGLSIAGRRRLLISAEFDYARMPREMWRQRIILARAAGFNALSIPIFWGFHEPSPNHYIFEDRRDLAHLLHLCRQERMLVVARVGPYVGGDWELGGLPPWLLAQMTHPRTHDRTFRAAVDHWFEKLAPALAAYQVQRGGTVVLVEVENDERSPISSVARDYVRHLYRKMRSLGVEVPIVMAHEETARKRGAAPPAADYPIRPPAKAVVHLGKARAWGDADVLYDHSSTVIGHIARGVRWIDCRALFGGMNFDIQAAEGLATRYDRGAPVGEAGGLRTSFYSLKRWLNWTHDAETLLSGECESTTIAATDGETLSVLRWRSETGEIEFLENQSASERVVSIVLGTSSPTVERIEIDARGVWPIVRNWRLSESVTIEACTALLVDAGIVAERRLLIAAAPPPGQRRTIAFRTPGPPHVELGGDAFAATSGGCTLQIAGAVDRRPRDYRFTAGGETVQVVAVAESLFGRVWRIDRGNDRALIIGGDILHAMATASTNATRIVMGSAVLPAEYRVYGQTTTPTIARGAVTRSEERGCWIVWAGDADPIPATVPALDRWQQREGAREAAVDFDDTSWTLAAEPHTVEQLPGDTSSPYVWYRTILDVPDYSTYTLQVSGIGDRAMVFYRGWLMGVIDGAHGDEIPFRLPRGRHPLALLVERDGRDALDRETWPIPDHWRKGLRPPALVFERGTRAPIYSWQFAPTAEPPMELGLTGPFPAANADWQNLAMSGPDDMNSRRGFARYRTRFRLPEEGTLEIYLHGADDRAWVYLNEQLVGTHADPRRGFLIRVPATVQLRRDAATYRMVIVVENDGGPGGLTGPVSLALSAQDSDLRLGPWRMRAGLGGEHGRWFSPPFTIGDHTSWGDVTTPTYQTSVRWYRTRFEYWPWKHAATGASEETWDDESLGFDRDRVEALFLHLGALRRGVVWFNGYRLGRYRRVGYDAERGVPLPACWLRRENWLVVAETGGGLPKGAFLARDGAGRYYLSELTVSPSDTPER